jgi:hypothetical protein
MENYNINVNINDPDYDIEIFWYSFKESMYNFYNSLTTDINSIVENNISEWSKELNFLKKEKNYNEIQMKIKKYMSMYALDLITYSDLLYHDSIFVANIRRWNKITNSLIILNPTSLSNNNIEEIEDKKIKFFFIFFTLKQHNVSTKDIDNLKNYDKLFIDNDYDDFIIYSLENNKPKILELLKDINSKKLKEDIKRLLPNFKFNIDSKMVKNCQKYKNINL